MRLVLTSESGKSSQISRRLPLMVHMPNEILQLQMIGGIELQPQIFRHEAIEIRPHHLTSDMLPATFITKKITQRNGTLSNLIPIVNT